MCTESKSDVTRCGGIKQRYRLTYTKSYIAVLHVIPSRQNMNLSLQDHDRHGGVQLGACEEV